MTGKRKHQKALVLLTALLTALVLATHWDGPYSPHIELDLKRLRKRSRIERILPILTKRIVSIFSLVDGSQTV